MKMDVKKMPTHYRQTNFITGGRGITGHGGGVEYIRGLEVNNDNPEFQTRFYFTCQLCPTFDAMKRSEKFLIETHPDERAAD